MQLVADAVVTVQLQSARRRIISVGCDPAIEHVVFAIHLKVSVLVPTLQQPPEDEDHHTVTDYEDALFPVVASEGSEEAVNAQCHIRAALASRRPVPVLSFAFAPGPFVGIAFPHSLMREAIKHP